MKKGAMSILDAKEKVTAASLALGLLVCLQELQLWEHVKPDVPCGRISDYLCRCLKPICKLPAVMFGIVLESLEKPDAIHIDNKKELHAVHCYNGC